MPVIRSYNPQVATPDARRNLNLTGANFGAIEARAAQGLGQQIQRTGEILFKRAEQEELAQATVKITEAQAGYANELNEIIRTADPGDKEVFNKFNEKIEQDFSKLSSSFSSPAARRYALESSARVRSQLERNAIQGQAELAGVKAVQDYNRSINNMSSTLMADPSSKDLQFELHKTTLENLVNAGLLDRASAVKQLAIGENELAKATIRGWVNLDPEYAKQKLKEGEFDSVLGADGKRQLFAEADQALRAKQIEAERKMREREEAIKRQQKVTQNDFLKAMVENKLTAEDILKSNLEAFGSGSKDQFLDMLRQAQARGDRLQTDGGTMIELFNRIHLPDGDPNKLVDENELNQYFGRGLSLPDLNRLRDELQGKQTESGRVEADLKRGLIEVAKGQLTKSNPLLGVRDPVGDEQMQKFMVLFLEEYKEQRKKGKTVRDLLDPNSPDYLGSLITQFKRSPNDIIRDMAPRKNTILADPKKENLPIKRLPNETAREFLERLKKQKANANGGN